MAAKRFGAVQTNITGLSTQILRVKTDESGFEFFTPATLPAYTATNVTTDRVFDASNSNVDELANVVGTLLADIVSVTLGQASPFQWSTSEQVWPFEKDAAGNTLYCKYYAIGTMPDTGWKSTAHNISAWSAAKVYRFNGLATSASDQYGSPGCVPIPLAAGHYVQCQVYAANINVYCPTNYYSANGYSGYIYLIYAK